MCARVSLSKSLQQTLDKSIRSEYLRWQIDPWEALQLSSKPVYSDWSVRRELVSSTQAYRDGWNRVFGSKRTQEMSPGNRAAEKMVAIAMARIREKDRRPKRKFKPGDIVLPHPKRADLRSVGEGIVLYEFKTTGKTYGVDDQDLFVFFAARDVDLYTEARRYARAMMMEPEFRPEGIKLTNADLEYTGRSEPKWLESPDLDEIQMMRFADVASEL